MIFVFSYANKTYFTRKEFGNDLHLFLFLFLGPFSRAVVPIWRGFVTNKYFYVRRFSSRQTKLTGGISARKWPSRGKNVRSYCHYCSYSYCSTCNKASFVGRAALCLLPPTSAQLLCIIICQFCSLPAKYTVAASYSVYMKHWLPTRLHWRVPFLLYSYCV